MDERAACALLKARFQAAGFQIEENRPFAEAGVQFEIDGYDPARRVGYEYVTSEAGDSWDVDERVIEVLAEQRRRGQLFVLVVDESDAPDAASLESKADSFLAEIPRAADADEKTDDDSAAEPDDDNAPTDRDDDTADDSAAEGAGDKKSSSKTPAKRTAKPAVKKAAVTAAAKKPATKKPATKKAAVTAAAKKPATKKPAKKRR